MAGVAVKRQNIPALLSVLALDSVVFFSLLNGFAPPSLTEAAFARALVSVAAPPAALLLSSVLAASIKDVLVFWRLRDVLPGHRAFSEHAHSDPRIDPERLQRNIDVAFPTGPREQNALWYRLFKKIEAEPAVEHANRTFLLLREIATLSIAAAICSAFAALAAPGPLQGRLFTAAGLLALQYVLAALGAANYGRRLVTTVLAAHSVKRRR